jgi:hypothetical protein
MGKHARIRTKSPRHRAEKGGQPVASSGMLAIAPAEPRYRRATAAEVVAADAAGSPVPWWLQPRDESNGVTA